MSEKILDKKWLENDLRDYLFDNHKESLHSLISGVRDNLVTESGSDRFSISKLLQSVTEKKISRFVDNLEDLTLIGKEVRLKQPNRSTTRIDLLGTSEGSILNIIELKKPEGTEREAFTELLGYANHYCLLFPGLKDSALNSVLIAPMRQRIVQDAYMQEVLINNKPILALKPSSNDEQGVDLQVYYPDRSTYKYFENNILNDQAMITVVLTFNEVEGWIDTDRKKTGTIPRYSKKALNAISSMISHRLEAEGLHSLTYASQQWGEMAELFPHPNRITVVAINPFASFRTSIHDGVIYGNSNESRISSIQTIYDQLDGNHRDFWVEFMEGGFHDRLIRIVNAVFEEALGTYKQNLSAKVTHHISTPDWYGLKTNLIESAFTYNLDAFCTGLLRDIVSEYTKLMYLEGEEDMELFPYNTINNWLHVWEILQAIGSNDDEF